MSNSSQLILKSALMTIAAILLLVAIGFGGLVLLIRSNSLADCSWNGKAVAWNDINQNGSPDPDEPALPEVMIHVADIENGLIDVAYGPVTNERGVASLEVFMPGCPNVDFEVYVDTPPGYILTTSERIHVKQDLFGALDRATTYYFGFAKIP
jgi:hypothetical protein